MEKNNTKERWPTANEFAKEAIQNQRKIITELMQEAMSNGNPYVKVPFVTYSIIDAEMVKKGWNVQSYEAENYENDYTIFYSDIDFSE